MAEPAVRQFHETFPQVELYVVEAYSATLREWLLAGKIDVAVLYSLRPEQGIATVDLLDDELCVVSAPFDAEGRKPSYTLEEVAQLPLILPSAPHGMHVFVEELFAHIDRRELDVHLTVDAIHVQKELIKNGVGYGILPYLAVQDDVRNGALAVARMTPSIRRKLVCGVPELRPRTVSVNAMLDLPRRAGVTDTERPARRRLSGILPIELAAREELPLHPRRSRAARPAGSNSSNETRRSGRSMTSPLVRLCCKTSIALRMPLTAAAVKSRRKDYRGDAEIL